VCWEAFGGWRVSVEAPLSLSAKVEGTHGGSHFSFGIASLQTYTKGMIGFVEFEMVVQFYVPSVGFPNLVGPMGVIGHKADLQLEA